MAALTRKQIKELADAINRLRSIAIQKYGKEQVEEWREERQLRLSMTYDNIFGEEF